MEALLIAVTSFSMRMSIGSSLDSHLKPYATSNIVLPNMLWELTFSDWSIGRELYSQFDMFQPVIGGLKKVVEKAVPRFLNKTLEEGILLLVDHLYEKTSLAAPGEKLDLYTEVS
jgi:hypothetical protein